MRIEHKNSLTTYLSNWLMVMNVRARAEGKSSSGLGMPQPARSLERHEFSLCVMLELFDDRLTRFEKALAGKILDSDYGAYAEAVTFLDVIYFLSRMLLDSAAGIVRHLHKWDTGDELPKSFNKMLERSVRGDLPNDLSVVFSGCETWFPQLKDRRDDIVHNYETCFIGFKLRSEGGMTAMQFSSRKGALAESELRSYVGTVMAGYQNFVDRLLDYWDGMFVASHGISVSRNRTILEGRTGNILGWAYRYGEYRNKDLFIDES
jgi:hypothetical protein